jgi:aspartate racemase
VGDEPGRGRGGEQAHNVEKRCVRDRAFGLEAGTAQDEEADATSFVRHGAKEAGFADSRLAYDQSDTSAPLACALQHPTQGGDLQVAANEGRTDDVVIEVHGQTRCVRTTGESMAPTLAGDAPIATARGRRSIESMTTVGIVGGLGPESTVDYYRRLLEAWEREDPSTAPSIVIDSLDVRRALHLVASDRPALTEYLLASLRRLAGAGVDFAAMTANTPHIVFDELAARSPVPLVSIVEVCAQDAQRRGLRRLALLGTRFTMEAPFYPVVCARYGVAVVPPNEAEQAWVHERYVGQLLRGEFRDDTRREFISLITRLRDEERIDGIILGGTELPLLLPSPVIADLPALDTTALHVAAIVKRLRQADVRAGAAAR